MKEDVRKALMIVWIAVGFASLAVLLASSSFIPAHCSYTGMPGLPQSTMENNPHCLGLYCGTLLNLVALRVFLGIEILRNVKRSS